MYQWTFEIKDVVNFAETVITVYGLTIKQCYQKIKAMKIPYLRTYTNIEEYLVLKEVIEIDEDLELDFEDEPKSVA